MTARVAVSALLSARYRHDSVVLPCNYAGEHVGARGVTGRSIVGLREPTCGAFGAYSRNSTIFSNGYRNYLLHYHLCARKVTCLCAGRLQGLFAALPIYC